MRPIPQIPSSLLELARTLKGDELTRAGRCQAIERAEYPAMFHDPHGAFYVLSTHMSGSRFTQVAESGRA